MKFLKFILLLLISFLAQNSSAQSNQYKNYSIAEGLPQSDVFDAVQDAMGYLWFATQGGGIARFDGEKFQVFTQNEGLLSNYTSTLLIRNDSLFIGTSKGLSIKYKNRFTNYKLPKINKLIVFDQVLYLATQEGIYELKKDYVAPVKINLKIDLSPIEDIIFYNSFYWIKTPNNVWKINRIKKSTILKKETLKNFETIPNKQQSILDNLKIDSTIKSILKKVFVDRQQNRWLLTLGNGVYKSTTSNFIHYDSFHSEKIGQITAVHHTEKKVWFADSKKKIYTIDSLGIQSLPTQPYVFKTKSITSDKHGNLWIGSEKKGIYIFRKQADSTKTSSYTIERLYKQNGFPYNSILRIHIQGEHVWVVTHNAGVVKLNYDFKKNFVKKITLFNKNNGLKDLAITTSLLHNNTIWYATKNGALGFITENSVTHYSKILKQTIPISTICFENNKLYLGTFGNGVWTTKLSQINNLKPLNNTLLSSKNIYQMLFDSKGQMWIGSEKGLDQLILHKQAIKKITHYNSNDGFTGVETSLNTLVEDAHENLWFGTRTGITKYIPATTIQAKTLPKIHFENIEIAYQNIDRLEQKFKNKVLQLSPKQNHISFTYKTIDINHPKRIEYRWKLNGSFSPWSRTNGINFANLSSGNYVFSVQSRNANKKESTLKTFNFFIDKPLHKKSWFIWSISSFLVCIILFLIYQYIRRIKLKNIAKIEKLQLENHLIVLEQKALQLQMNPHFIFNVLNGIKALGNSGNTKELNTTVNQFANLLRATLYNSRKDEINLSEEIKTLKNYLNLEQQMNPFSFDYFINSNTKDIDPEEILIPPMLIQPFIENSIKHGFKGKTEKGKITVQFDVKDNNLNCKITDNGVGFFHSQKEKENSNHKSMALKVTKERIKNLSKNSTLDISEIICKNKIHGTKIEFKLPLKTDY